MKHLIAKLPTSSLWALACVCVVGSTSPEARAQARTGPAQEEESIMLSPFEVSSGKDDGYAATNAISGTRFKTELMDLPKPVDVITSEFMADIGAVQIADALRYVSGIAQNDANGPDNGVGGNFAVRGYSTFTTYRNGYRSFGVADNLFTDRIEVIKGPSSVFSGTIEPGGTINVVTARPPTKASGFVSMRYGSYDRRRAELVWGGPLNRSGTLSCRLAGALEDYGYAWDFARRDRVVYGGVIAWQVARRTKATVDLQFVDSRAVPFREAVLLNAAATELLKDYNRGFNRVGPDAFDRRTQGSAIAELTHEFNRVWTARVGTYWRYQDQYSYTDSGSSRVAIDAKTGARTVNRAPAIITQLSHNWVPQASLLGNFEYAGLKHKAMLFADFSYSDSDDRTRTLPTTVVVPRMDIDNPTGYLVARDEELTRRTVDTHLYSIQRGFSFSNVWQAFRDRLTVLQGYRYGTSYSDSVNKLRDPAAKIATHARSKDTWNYGASYRLVGPVSAYVSYAESYLPQTTRDFAGNLFEAITGSGYDYGLKFNLPARRISGSVSGYRIKRANVPQPDPDHAGFQVQTGEDLAEGFEAALMMRPVDPWQVVLSYGYIETEVLKDPTRPQNVGLRTANVPRHQGSLWNRYAFKNGLLKGLGVGLGVVAVDKRRGNPNLADLPGLRSPAYTRLDFNGTYERKVFGRPTYFSLMISNLTDADYMPSYYSYGEPINFMSMVKMTF